MKKLLSLALAAMMMVASSSAVFAVDGNECPASEAASPKIWASYDSYDESCGQYIYNINFDPGETLVKVTASKGKYTGKAIIGMDVAIPIDTAVWKVDGGDDDIYAEAYDMGVVTGAQGKYDANNEQFVYMYSVGTGTPLDMPAFTKGVIAQLWLKPIDAEGFDPYTARLDFGQVQVTVNEYAGEKTFKYQTRYGNVSTADYPIALSYGVEVLTDVKEDGKQIVAHTENVSGVKATTTVDVTYGSETKTFGDFGSLLGISGEGTADGTVRFAVKAPASMDPNGFLFKINY